VSPFVDTETIFLLCASGISFEIGHWDTIDTRYIVPMRHCIRICFSVLINMHLLGALQSKPAPYAGIALTKFFRSYMKGYVQGASDPDYPLLNVHMLERMSCLQHIPRLLSLPLRSSLLL